MNSFSYEEIQFSKPYKISSKEGKISYAIHVLYLNDYSALIEIWFLDLKEINNNWKIEKKRILKTFSGLYRLKIPGDKVKRAERIEINHYDIRLIFENSLIFFDNIPELDTGFIILGKGKVIFTPSSPHEKHQLKLYYKSEKIENKIEYSYIRMSPHLFSKKIKLYGASSVKVDKYIKNKVYSIFRKSYPRSFTIETPLTDELFTLIPQGEDMVIEFKGPKIGELTYIYSSFSKESINLYDRKRNKIISLYSPLTSSKLKRFFISFEEKANVESYDIDITFNPSKLYFYGKIKINLRTNYLYIESLQFKFNRNLKITNIYDDRGNSLFFSWDRLRENLYIYLLSPQEKYTFSITIFYRGRIKPVKEISDVIPQINPLNTPIKHSRIRYRTYLYSYSSLWYPVYSSTDYFKASLKITIPSKYTCLANGQKIKIETDEIKKEKTYYFLIDYPVKYLSFIVGEFVLNSEEKKPIFIEAYSTPDTTSKEEGELIKDIINFYEEKFGPYPYPKLTLIKRTFNLKGGHSPASLIILNTLPQKKGLFRYSSPVDLSQWKGYFLAHEIAHQWWGQTITWDTYHDQWLSEGFAQFASILYLKKRYGEGVFNYSLEKFNKWVRKKSKAGAIILGPRIGHINNDTNALLAIVYNKTALVLNLLKDIIGEDKFFEILRDFLRDKKFNRVSTLDFKKYIEEKSGINL
ncbi:hypothetical protein NLD30_11105, partial [SCandidatus Aminicenantes bacterium Aminicenantia_JdfR_composite]|nr:hypothetical protein [SCandidatus Aminicenantes bacterium Aminicenantia_JdfR_composite]